jgi:DNA-binding NtrC family response regulator
MLHPRVLIIDDERNFGTFLGEALRAHDYAVDIGRTAQAGLTLARQKAPHVVLLDQNLPDRPGLEILPELRALPSNPVIIVITAYAAYPLAVDAIKAGAFHYLAKPFDFEDLLRTLADACVGIQDGGDRAEPDALAGLVGNAGAIRDLKQRIVRVAQSPVNSVLVQGESGTGKELVARAIHALSSRSGRRLVCVNCAALTESLLMSELFGHEKGAFTDAREQRKGLFEAANGGTLFLDEISEIGPRAQAALLRVLEERVVTRVGGTDEIPVDIRVIAATNRLLDLDRNIAEGAFRADLYYRLNVVRLELPPLRDRGQDLLLLARHFSADVASRYGVATRALAPEAESLLSSYHWPGNVRELRNAIERAYIVGTGMRITPADLPSELTKRTPPGANTAGIVYAATDGRGFQEAKQTVIDEFERAYVEALMRRAGGNITHAAEEAGILRQAFQRLLKRHGLDREMYHSN